MANPRWKFTPDASQLDRESEGKSGSILYLAKKERDNGAPVVGEGTRLG